MMSEAPLFTIVVATHNACNTLQHCIDSITGQTFESRELIVIDGGSTDGTLDVLEGNDTSITTWISEPDTGIFDAWNKALVRGSGEWLLFLGADDFLLSTDVLARVASALARIPGDRRVAYGRVRYVTRGASYLYTKGVPWEDAGPRFPQVMSIPHQGVFHRRSLFVEHGCFDTQFKIGGDYEFLLRELRKRPAVFLDVDIAAMRQSGISSDLSNSMTILREMRLAQRKNGILRPGPLWILAWMRVHLRLLLWRILGERVTRRLLDAGRVITAHKPHWTRNA
jgi:glycosyltransferase involved in cell wall biosynthesis